MALIFVDVEAHGPSPSVGVMTEVGAVRFKRDQQPEDWDRFHGVIVSRAEREGRGVQEVRALVDPDTERKVLEAFASWLNIEKELPIFVSDNNGFDFMWVCDAFWRVLGRNPFGHSSRRISDFYAGLVGDFREATRWKHLRRPYPHTHISIDDAIGNAWAFKQILEGKR